MRENFDKYSDSELKAIKSNIENVLMARKVATVTKSMEKVKNALYELAVIAPNAYFLPMEGDSMTIGEICDLIDPDTETEIELDALAL